MRPLTLTIARSTTRGVVGRALTRIVLLIVVCGLVAPASAALAAVGAGARIDGAPPDIASGAGVVPGANVVRRAGLGTAGDARAAPGAGPVIDTGWSSPVPGPAVVTRAFEAPAAIWAAGHRGVDLATSVGATVLSPADGVVTFAGTVVDRDVLTITHPDGLRSSLEPMIATVAVGTRVGRGTVVGAVQDVPTHCVPQVCLHWGVRDGATYLDPMHLLTGGPVVLLPWDDGAG